MKQSDLANGKSYNSLSIKGSGRSISNARLLVGICFVLASIPGLLYVGFLALGAGPWLGFILMAYWQILLPSLAALLIGLSVLFVRKSI